MTIVNTMCVTRNVRTHYYFLLHLRIFLTFYFAHVQDTNRMYAARDIVFVYCEVL